MKRYAVRVFYNGQNYYGYQRQPDHVTVEGTIIEALSKINYIETPDINQFRSASRTDRYVSAIGNVFAFNSSLEVNLEQLNATLPKDKSIVCWGISEVPKEFSPKYSKWKKYWYVLPSEHIISKESLDLVKLKNICESFEGENDFKLFCKMDHRKTIREIRKLDIFEKEDSLIFEFKANSFLWEQVRRIMSYIINYNELPNSLQNTKKLLSPTPGIKILNLEPADPKQLILVEHYYGSIKWTINKLAVERIIKKMNEYIHSLQRQKSTIKSIQNFFISSSINRE